MVLVVLMSSNVETVSFLFTLCFIFIKLAKTFGCILLPINVPEVNLYTNCLNLRISKPRLSAYQTVNMASANYIYIFFSVSFADIKKFVNFKIITSTPRALKIAVKLTREQRAGNSAFSMP